MRGKGNPFLCLPRTSFLRAQGLRWEGRSEIISVVCYYGGSEAETTLSLLALSPLVPQPGAVFLHLLSNFCCGSDSYSPQKCK